MTSPTALAARVAELPRPLLLAFDVDGTLAPIVDDPARARVPQASARALRRLVKVRGVTVALVTGRDLASLGALVRVAGAYRAVEHGARIVAPGATARAPRLGAAERERLTDFERWVRATAVPLGAKLERKPRARVLHVRVLERRDPAAARRLLAEAGRKARALGLHDRRGRAVLEAELTPGDKGEALGRLQRVTRARSVVYLGDDLTDYPAIQRAGELGGLGVFVRSPERRRAPRAANAVLGNQAQVGEFLHALLELLAPREV